MRGAVLSLGVLVALIGSPVSAAAAGARGALDEGLALFAARRFEEAAVSFGEAAAKAGAEGLDPAVAGYDQAVALLKAGKAVEAAAAFADVVRAADPRLRESAHYHRGIALVAAADAAESGGQTRKALTLLEEALGAYESAMRIDPGDEDPKVNHELAARKLAQLLARQQESGGGQRGQDQEGNAGASPPREPERREAEQPRRPPREGSSEKEMRPDEARTLLDAMRQQEQSQRGRTRPFRGEAAAVEKDW